MRKRSSRAALTIIELLVAVGIVALLGLFLFPSFRSARESSKQVKCLGQLRQIVFALVMYADDNDGYGPATPLDGVVAANEISDGVPDVPIMLSKYRITEETFHCPSDKIAYFQAGYGSSYIYNGSPSRRLFESYPISQPGDVFDSSRLPLIGEGMTLHRQANNVAFLDGHAALERPQ